MPSLDFSISGRVYEKESGRSAPGLIVRAYDKDLLFDDLLGSAITDAFGKFELSYADSDFRELFDSRPDIYLSIYAPPCRFLMDTRDSIRWNAGKEATFEIAISREVLGSSSPTPADHQVQGGLSLSENALTIEQRGGFDVPHLPGFSTTGSPGAPAVPHQMRYVALPLGGDVLEFEVIPGEAVRIEAQTPLPAQEPFPDVGIDPKTGGGFSIENVHFQMTPPDPRYFEGAARYPAHLAELVKVEEIGPIQIAAISVTPVQYDAATRSYLFYPELKYRVTFDREKARKTADSRRQAKATVGELRAEHLDIFLRNDRVDVAVDLHWPGILVLEDTPHVIITDNFQWPESVTESDGTTRPPTLAELGAALTGDLVAEFQRLAAWRTSHGIRSRVVTISQIVGGTFGDCTEGGFARDLAEVIRNFLKYAHANWDTLYAVLGGDVNVVPMRRMTGAGGYGTFGVSRLSANPPTPAGCHFLAVQHVCKLRPDFVPEIGEPLSTFHGGVRIPYNREAGSGSLGWYYTSEAHFTGRSEGFVRLPDSTPTHFVIVEGPNAVIDDDYYWVRDVNSIPSDFYYASLVGPRYSVPGKHDFDDNNNLLYGQTHWNPVTSREESLDGVDFYSDVWVGRVAAESASEVQAFVDKVITYEDLRSPGTPSVNVDTSYLRKVLYASDYWGLAWQSPQPDTSIPPAEAHFTHVAGTTVTKIHTNFNVTLVGTNPSHRLVGRTGNTQVVVPYNEAASPTSAGWFFTTASDYATLSSMMTTRFIKLVGPEATINQDSFFWDPVGLESAAVEKEKMRGLMNSWFSDFKNVQRHYSDYFDLTAPPAVVPLDSTVLRAAMNAGQHFVSLTGHGWSGGCCTINSIAEPDFTNNHQYFIAFADSCSTSRPDGGDSLGETSVLDAGGGAVAYVGNTRYSWIGVGDNYEHIFWCMLAWDGRVGPAAGMRLATEGVRSLWTFYAQTLYGDPAMRVWQEDPIELRIVIPEFYHLKDLLPVMVERKGKPLRDARVTLTGGGSEVFLSKKTNSDGKAGFTLPGVAESMDQLTVTVWSLEGKLHRGVIRNGR